MSTGSVEITTAEQESSESTVQSQMGLVPSISSPFDIARIVLSALLLIAALLKAHQLATAPVPETGLLSSRWFLITVVECELALGLWFLTGWHPKLIRLVGMACFALFGSVALFKAFQGAESCGCFGRVTISPWWTAAIDLLAVIALAVFRPESKTLELHRHSWHPTRRLIPACVALLMLGLPAGWAMATFNPTRVNDDGVLGDGQIVVLEPQEWIGKPFPLVSHIDLGERLRTGSWRVVLYHHDCPKCQEVIAKWQAADQSGEIGPDSPTIALVDMPPYGPPQSHPASSDSRLVYCGLSDKREWFVTAPVEIEVHDGTVTAVSD
jgi:hypothetical protein